MSVSRSAVVAALLLASAVAAAPAAAAPTLGFDRPCYTPEQPMVMSGSGYTPSGGLLIFFARLGPFTDVFGSLETTADPAGAFSLNVKAPDLKKDSIRDEVTVAANDRVKVDAGGSPPEAVGAATFTLTDTGVNVPRWDNNKAPSRRKTVTVDAAGYTLDIGKNLYAHYVRSGKSFGRLRVGKLGGDCGDVKAKMKQFPAGLKPGRYTVAFNARKKFSKSDFYVFWRVTKL